jgi:RecA-family ATPase
MTALPSPVPGNGPPPRAWTQGKPAAVVPSIHVTFFRDKYASTLKATTMSLSALRDLIVTTSADKRDNLPWLKLAKFGNQKSADKSLRHDENVISINGVELDYDKKQIPFTQAVGIIKQARLQALLYTTPSHTDEQPKWRILLPTSKELPPTERGQLVARVNGLFGGIFDPASFTLSQSYYFGSVNNNRAHRAEIVDGEFIDLRSDLDQRAMHRDAGPKKSNSTTGSQDWAPLLENIHADRELHDSTRDLAAKLIAAGTDPGACVNLLRGSMQQSTAPRDRRWQDRFDDIPNLVASAQKKFGNTDQASPPLKIVSAATLANKPVPERVWHVPDLIPARTVTNISGDGGVGKSLLFLQLSVATVLDRLWLDHKVRAGGVVYLSAEDEIDEQHRRLAKIAAAEGISLADLGNLQILPYAGLDAILAEPVGRSNRIESTPLWHQIRQAAANLKPKLVVFDTQSDVFAGDENNRAQVRQFVGMLRGLAIENDLTAMLLSHPSLTGISSGSGSSGSTGWNNAVRSRFYLERILIDGDEVDTDLRRLTNKKMNYGRRGYEIVVRWVDGVFVSDGTGSQGGLVNLNVETELAFLHLLSAYNAEGRAVNASRGCNFAPAVFARDPRAKGTSKRKFEVAMNRLFEVRKVEVVSIGPPSKRRQNLVPVSPVVGEAK